MAQGDNVYRLEVSWNVQHVLDLGIVKRSSYNSHKPQRRGLEADVLGHVPGLDMNVAVPSLAVLAFDSFKNSSYDQYNRRLFYESLAKRGR